MEQKRHIFNISHFKRKGDEMKSRNFVLVLVFMAIFLLFFGCAHKIDKIPFKLPPKEQIPDEISKEVRHSILGLYNCNPANNFQLHCQIAAKELRDMGKKAKEAVPYLIIIARSQINSFGGYGETRRMAIKALGEIGDERATIPLIEALKYPDQRIQAPAAEALGKIGDTRAILPLIHALEYSNNSSTAGGARAGLVLIDDPQAAEPLIELLSRRKDYVRGYVADILGSLGDNRAIEPLIDMYRNDPRKGNSKSALKALIKLKDVRAIDLYIECIENPTQYNRKTRHDAAKCLLEIDHPKAIAARSKAQTVIDQTTPIYEISNYDFLGRLEKQILRNQKGEKVASKIYVYKGMSKSLIYINIATEADGHAEMIKCDKFSKPEINKYLCLDRFGNVLYTNGVPIIIEVSKPIKQFSRSFASRKEKGRLIYPVSETDIMLDKDCKYVW